MGDGASVTHYHSTHVAGTIMASGVQANSKGMAPAANLRAFDWNSDEAEMASEAALGTLFPITHMVLQRVGHGMELMDYWYGNSSCYAP